MSLFYSCEAVSWAKLYCGALGFLQFKEFELYWGAVFFLQFKEIELYWGAVFFLRSVHTFHDFWSQIGVVILVTPKQEVERKSKWFCGVKFFRSKFKVEWENGVWTKIRFLASGFLFTCGNFNLIFTVFSIFFLNGFSNPFIVRSRSSFLFSQWKLFELYVRTCPAMFFLRSVHSFSWFLKSNWSSDFGHAETGNGAKKRVVLRGEIFSL